MPAAVPGLYRGCHAALPREFTSTSRSGAQGNAATPQKKSARNSQAVVGTSAQADEGPWQGRQRRGRFNLYCSSSHGNQLSCAQFQLFLTPLEERCGLLRAGRDRWTPSPGSAGDQCPGPGGGSGQEGQREPGSGREGLAGLGAVRCAGRSLNLILLGAPEGRDDIHRDRMASRGTGWHL